MSEFKIEKGFPVIQAKTGRKAKYPFAQMEIGDSFFVADEADNKAGTNARISALCYAKRHPEYKFVSGKVEGGHRIWRVKP